MQYRSFILVTGALLVCFFGNSTVADHPPAANQRPVVLLSGLGSHHHPVATSNAEAQRFFDQGLSLIYAFNHDEAVRAFRRAAELDPKMAMAQWGIALALGSNYNLEAQPEQLQAAHDALQKALALAKDAPEPERAYIQALAKRYSADTKSDPKQLAVDYKNAMGDLARRYPDDLDAKTLSAESAMNLRPWKLWSHDGKPEEGTEEIVAVLEAVLKRSPNHMGANHYYIHAVEASPNPERALPSAERLKTLAPAAGHLVHMPAHIFLRVGDYEQAARQNELAMAADESYLYTSGATGVYPMMYYSHNIHFLAAARAMQGRYAEAIKAAEQLTAHVGPHVKDMPMLEAFMPTPLLIRVRFHRWQEILDSPAPDQKQAATTALWHFARGVAFAANGNVEAADKEHQAFLVTIKGLPPMTMFSPQNDAASVFAVAEGVLAAKIALARQDKKTAIGLLTQAVKAEDALNYMEPADWSLTVRESLGGALLLNGDAAEAEKVFRADLDKHPRNGRSLFGLMESLKAQKKTYDAQMVQLEFEAAWKNANGMELHVEDL
jgi:tetratricopeptide (TPR) repeat protein